MLHNLKREAYNKIGEKMRERIKQFLGSKQFHIIMVILIIIAIIFVVGFISLRYNVEGEGNPPFYLTKISTISSVEGTDAEDAQNKWNLTVNQNNDVYLYIEKNNSYQETETIKNVVLNNFNIYQQPKIGQIKLLKPDVNTENTIFKNTAEDETDSIEYTGDTTSDIKNMKVSNQGGLIVFRYAIGNLGNYISNDDEQINHNDLLNKLSINNDDLKFAVSFDVTINLNSGKAYKSTLNLNLPVGDVVNGGIQSEENTNLQDVVFKRITN